MEEEASDYYVEEGEVAAVPPEARGSEKAGLNPSSRATTSGVMAVAGPPQATKENAMASRPSQAVARMNPYEMEDC